MAVCASPQLIAAYHVLHRLLVPRHSPCALYSLTCGNFRCKDCIYAQSQVSRSSLSSEIVTRIPGSQGCYTSLPFCSLPSHSLIHYTVFKEQSGNYPTSAVLLLPCFYVVLPGIRFPVSSFHSGGLKWNRTIDLTLIRRAL